MSDLHSLLKRQISKYLRNNDAPPGEMHEFIEAINSAYFQFDEDRTMLERSLDLSSRELLEANSEMRALFQAFPDLYFCLDFEGKILDYLVSNYMSGDEALSAMEAAKEEFIGNDEEDEDF